MTNKDNRSEQMPIRVTIAEKIQVIKDAKDSDYKDVAKYVRAKLGLND